MKVHFEFIKSVRLGVFCLLALCSFYGCSSKKDLEADLAYAVSTSNVSKVLKLLDQGVDVNGTGGDDGSRTPLHLSVTSPLENEMPKVTHILLREGANVNAQDCNGSTPLHAAASLGYVNTVSMLLERGADPSIRNNKGRSPLDLARQMQRFDVVALLSSGR